MTIITANKVKELENRKVELLESLHRITENIAVQRDNLADKIYETEDEIAKFGKVRMGAPVNEDIFNADAILASETAMTKEDFQKRLNLFARAYATNPFCDKKKATDVLNVLDELGEIVEMLDAYYNESVKKAAAAIKEAEKAYQTATSARRQHQRKTNEAVTAIREAASRDRIGYNHLLQLGVTLDDFGMQMCPGVGYDGKIIIDGAKHMIFTKIKDVEKTRQIKVSSRQISQFRDAAYIPGEPVAVFD